MALACPCKAVRAETIPIVSTTARFVYVDNCESTDAIHRIAWLKAIPEAYEDKAAGLTVEINVIADINWYRASVGVKGYAVSDWWESGESEGKTFYFRVYAKEAVESRLAWVSAQLAARGQGNESSRSFLFRISATCRLRFTCSEAAAPSHIRPTITTLLHNTPYVQLPVALRSLTVALYLHRTVETPAQACKQGRSSSSTPGTKCRGGPHPLSKYTGAEYRNIAMKTGRKRCAQVLLRVWRVA